MEQKLILSEAAFIQQGHCVNGEWVPTEPSCAEEDATHGIGVTVLGHTDDDATSYNAEQGRAHPQPVVEDDQLKTILKRLLQYKSYKDKISGQMLQRLQDHHHFALFEFPEWKTPVKSLFQMPCPVLSLFRTPCPVTHLFQTPLDLPPEAAAVPPDLPDPLPTTANVLLDLPNSPPVAAAAPQDLPGVGLPTCNSSGHARLLSSVPRGHLYSLPASCRGHGPSLPGDFYGCVPWQARDHITQFSSVANDSRPAPLTVLPASKTAHMLPDPIHGFVLIPIFMPGKGKKKGKKRSQRPPRSRAVKPPVFLGTPRTPDAGLGAESGESYGTTSGNQDWYKDFQSSELDSATIQRRDLPSSWPRCKEPQAGRNPLNYFGGPLCMVRDRTLQSPTETSRTTRTGTLRWALLGPTTPAWMIIGATLIMERQGSVATSVCGWTWGPVVSRTLQWSWKRTLIGIFPPTVTPKALRTLNLQHPRLCLRPHPGHTTLEQIYT
ncbi:hypothetical protein P4O66_002356 [Electrophorus voltai]|uniref:Uncharacterized protein n=1 Tax=Electrophorus voltai TaxID=2609070 RepID=A0AAD8YZW8_9TELE|nr:hypothetical protein P4O66_002356 [Electrophorus voltai]